MSALMPWACALALGLGGAGCAAETDATSSSDAVGAAEEELFARRGPPPVIFDHDADFDDMAALAYAVRLHKAGEIDLRLVTVTSAGAGFYGPGIRHTRCLLDRLGASDIPVADSPEEGPNHFPNILRFTMDAILTDLEDGCTATNDPSPVPAPEAILDVLDSSRRPVTIVVTGTTTNIANAIRIRQGQHHRRPVWSMAGRVWVMGGAIGAPGGLCCGLETAYDQTQTFNIWTDPEAAQTLLDNFLPLQLTFVGYNVTVNAPIRDEFVQRLLNEGTTPETEYVGTLANHPILAGAIAAGLPVYWWDPMTEVASTTHGVVEYDLKRVRIITEPGPSEGRMEEVSWREPGALVSFAVDADQEAFEDAFFDGLNAPIE